MVNKCVVFGCKSGYDNQNEKISGFSFPFNKPDLLEKWVKFVNRADWKPSKSSIICVQHFKEELFTQGQRNTLKWKMQPVPTIHTQSILKRPSTIPSITLPRKAPKVRVYRNDELEKFQNVDIIKGFADLGPKNGPTGYHCHKADDYILYYNLVFQTESGFPSIREAIRVDNNLNVKLQVCSMPVPLPSWFVNGRNAQLTRYSMLANFPAYLAGCCENENKIISEMNKLQHYSAKGRAPYSAEMIRFALLIRYTSGQAYRLLSEILPLPSMSLLRKLRKGNVDSLKAVKLLLETEQISKDVVMMVDEMYLQKCVQFSGENYVGSNDDGVLYKGIMAFMIQGLKQSVPVVVKACPETTVKGEWLAREMADCIEQLSLQGFNVRAVVTDNHTSNVSAFRILQTMYHSNDVHFIEHPQSSTKTYLFFDNVHLVKNIRNNLLNGRKFVFPPFSFGVGDLAKTTSDGGYVAWSDLHHIYKEDEKLSSNLKKAHRVSYKVLNPYNNKQNVSLALAVFSETTVAATKCYLPDRDDAASFLKLINMWWTTVNSKTRFCPNKLGNGMIPDDGKIDFWFSLSDWLESWRSSSHSLCLSKQTSDALIRTLRAQGSLCRDLFEEGYQFILTAKFQSDRLERRFSQYRQMSGGHFLVSLREILQSEDTLLCRSLLKRSINFWKEGLMKDPPNPEKFMELLICEDCDVDTVALSPESEDVGFTIAGYIAKKLKKRLSCEECNENATSESTDCPYFLHLSRGGLTSPSSSFSEFVCKGFALLDLHDNFIHRQSFISTREAALCMLRYHLNDIQVLCDSHHQQGIEITLKMLVNIFYNNKQKLVNDSVVKDTVTAFKRRQREKQT